MTHIAIQEQLDGKAVEWLEQVSDAEYGRGPEGLDPSTNERQAHP